MRVPACTRAFAPPDLGFPRPRGPSPIHAKTYGKGLRRPSIWDDWGPTETRSGRVPRATLRMILAPCRIRRMFRCEPPYFANETGGYAGGEHLHPIRYRRFSHGWGWDPNSVTAPARRRTFGLSKRSEILRPIISDHPGTHHRPSSRRRTSEDFPRDSPGRRSHVEAIHLRRSRFAQRYGIGGDNIRYRCRAEWQCFPVRHPVEPSPLRTQPVTVALIKANPWSGL